MRATALTLIPATQHGTANGNYDGTSESFSGVPVKAAGYYTKYKHLQTASWHLNDLVGYVTIEATLDDDPDTGEYFAIAPVIGDNVNPVIEDEATNIDGKFTWIRATVTEFTAGAITKISIGY